MDEKTIARFWSKVDKNGPVPSHMPHLGNCWIWTGCRNEKGYGGFGKHQKAHRVSWRLHNGNPVGMCVLHQCDTPACVNPSHLFLGTIRDNNRDMAQKGRQFVPHRRGSDHRSAKLTESDVLEIRRLRTTGLTQWALARQFGVGQYTIWAIVTGKSWKHVSHQSAE